jgi:hypothetical protein
MTKKCTYGHKIFQMTAKIFKWPKQTPTFTIPRSSKIYPNWDFWHVNIPSGHIGCNQTVFKICLCALAAWLSMCCYVRVVRLNLSRVHRGSFIFFFCFDRALIGSHLRWKIYSWHVRLAWFLLCLISKKSSILALQMEIQEVQLTTKRSTTYVCILITNAFQLAKWTAERTAVMEKRLLLLPSSNVNMTRQKCHFLEYQYEYNRETV